MSDVTTSGQITHLLASAMPWMATDASGAAYFFQSKPRPAPEGRSFWVSDGAQVSAWAATAAGCPDWRTILFQYNPILREWESAHV